MGSGAVGNIGTNLLQTDSIIEVHITRQVTKATNTDKSRVRSPKNSILMRRTKFEDWLTSRVVHSRLRRHGTSNNDELGAIRRPLNVLNWTLLGLFDLVRDITIVAEDEESRGTIVTATRVINIALGVSKKVGTSAVPEEISGGSSNSSTRSKRTV